jgi:hypothetical protein
MDIAQLISDIIILFAIGITYYWQKERIKSQKSTIDGMKKVTDGMAKYTKAFEVYKNTYNPDEFEKNKNWALEQAKKEYEKK